MNVALCKCGIDLSEHEDIISHPFTAAGTRHRCGEALPNGYSCQRPRWHEDDGVDHGPIPLDITVLPTRQYDELVSDIDTPDDAPQLRILVLETRINMALAMLEHFERPPAWGPNEHGEMMVDMSVDDLVQDLARVRAALDGTLSPQPTRRSRTHD